MKRAPVLGQASAVAIAVMGAAIWWAFGTRAGITASILLGLLLIACAIQQVLTALVRGEQTRVEELRLERERQSELYLSTIEALATAIDAKERLSRTHIVRVQQYAVATAVRMGLGERLVEGIRTAALLHDIGMLGVPEHILSKPAELTEEEYRKVMTHPETSARILEPIHFPWPVLEIVRYHQERYNGSGYPKGLRGDEIPIGARVLAVADVYESLTSKRPYRPAFPKEQARAYIRQHDGILFDPRVTAAFLQVVDEVDARHRFDSATGLSITPSAAMALQAPRRSVMEDIAGTNQELVALYEIAQTMGASLNLSETLQLITSKVRNIVKFSTCVIFLADSLGQDLVAEIAVGRYAELLSAKRLPLNDGLFARVLETGKASFSASPSQDLGIDVPDLSSGLVAPLHSEGQPLGTINLYHTEPRVYGDDDLRLLSVIASQAALAIENARVFERTKESALHDQLTGLPNARYLFLHLEQEIGRSKRNGRPLSVLGLDLDGFKPVNDLFGHRQGDRVLSELAELFRRQVREYDTVVRHAGDEFIILLPETSREEAEETAKRIKQAMSDYDPHLHHQRHLTLGVSIGIATYPHDATDLETLIAVADARMYEEKRAHKRQQHLTV